MNLSTFCAKPKWGRSREAEKFLGRYVEFGPAVRLYGEGRATGPPKDLRLKTVTGEKNHAAISGC
jgi:hypothetical protein